MIETTMKKTIHKLSENEFIVIYCKTKTKNICSIERFIKEIQCGEDKLCLFDESEEILVFTKDISFIETCNRKVYVHANSKRYTSRLKLCEIEKILPSSFVRISKSTIINMNYLQSLKKEKNGIGTVSLNGVPSPVYFSRMYYKNIREYLNKINQQ